MPITAQHIKQISFADFDPNNFGQDQEAWAVFDCQRFRTFGTRAPALTAFMASHQAKLYWMERSGMWRELAVKDGMAAPGKVCDWCGNPPSRYAYRQWRWEKFFGKIPPGPDGIKLLYLCDPCKHVNG